MIGSVLLFLGISPFGDWISTSSLDPLGIDGAYSIDEIVLTNELDSTGRPVRSANKFRPSERIIGWVSTQGAEGIVGMRWYYEDELIFEHFGKTEDNEILTYLQSTADITLPEGEYRLDIHITPGTPKTTIPFIVEQYEPNVIPPQPTPTNHTDIENSAFVDVPFVFDEVWLIGDRAWHINEVKVTFIEEDVFVTVAVDVELDLSKLSEQQAFAITKPIAVYAINNGYLDQARNLQIDDKFYDLDEIIYVNLVNRKSTDPFKQTGKPVYRTGFNINDLVGPQG
jgi:hypothetical protein